MIDGIAHQMDQGIADFISHGLIEFVSSPRISKRTCFFSFCERSRTIRGQFREHFLDRKHAGFHDGQLQIGGDKIELREGFAQHSDLGIGFMILSSCSADLDQSIATQDQLSDQIHHTVEPFGFYSDRGIFLGRFALLFLFVERGPVRVR